MTDDRARWARALLSRSVLKQRKVRELLRSLGTSEGRRCLDLGSDNGVVSMMLREHGGAWASGDLTAEAVAAIRGLVTTDVHLVDSSALPFPDRAFDAVVVVDMLEHAVDETAFVAELARVTRPGGRLVVNTPHHKDTFLKRFRHAIGQTDAKHGHLRGGYTGARVATLLGGEFRVTESRTYSRFFSELIDTLINFGVERLGKGSSAKGMVVTGDDLAKHRRVFRVYSLIYPLVRAIAALDALLPWASGYMLIVSAERR